MSLVAPSTPSAPSRASSRRADSSSSSSASASANQANRDAYRDNLLRSIKAKEEAEAVLDRFKPDKNFHTTLTFHNDMPEVPAGPHFVKINPSLTNEECGRYFCSSLERGYKWQLHADATLGMKVSLVDPEQWKAPLDTIRLPEADARIIRWSETKTKLGKLSAVSATPKRWLLKPRITENHLYNNVSVDAAEPEVIPDGPAPAKPKTQFDATDLLENQYSVDYINKSFDLAHKKIGIEKEGVEVEWSIPFLPDENLWSNSYSQIGFNVDPEVEGDVDRSPRKRVREEQTALKSHKRMLSSILANARKQDSEVAAEKFEMSLVAVSASTIENEKRNWCLEGDFEWMRDYSFEKKSVHHPMVMILDANPESRYMDAAAKELLEQELHVPVVSTGMPRCTYLPLNWFWMSSKLSLKEGAVAYSATVKRRPCDPWERRDRKEKAMGVWMIEPQSAHSGGLGVLEGLGPRPKREEEEDENEGSDGFEGGRDEGVFGDEDDEEEQGIQKRSRHVINHDDGNADEEDEL